ncbi:MAG: endonuclease/exonuclease/phosphatase family protein [Rhodobacteraceae bacterium]|jgi:hypothetical protein|nr:endonuclease/exonuclease/phosphatase family protein [Paracoccaceae bacterium]
MRIATWNVEWFTHLFDDDNRLIADDGPSGREGVTRAAQAAAVAAVLGALDADALLIVEAPDESRRRSCTVALEGFAARFGLRCRRALTGFASASQQELALLYDPAALTPVHDPRGAPTGKRGAAGAPRFDGAFRVALEDGRPTRVVTFARPPLEILAESARGGLFRMIGVHVKSKAPHAAKSPEQIPAVARENRRIQQGQCRWLRLRIEEHLAAGEPLVVLGDFNDGPGFDDFEQEFALSAVEIVLGRDRPRHLHLHDAHARAALGKRLAAAPSSARFLVGPEQHYFSALLDYVMVSPDLCPLAGRWRIWHPFDDPACYADAALRSALLDASDHYPVSLDIEL